ncbi:MULTISPECIES: hypothetical protein [unclassified Wolbachia]|nr:MULTISPECIES: hypothetical protein [unclassified Wolbachia]
MLTNLVPNLDPSSQGTGMTKEGITPVSATQMTPFFYLVWVMQEV